LIFQEADAGLGFGTDEYWRGLNAVAAVVHNRVAYLNQPGLRQSQTLGFGSVGASIADVVYSRGLNPNGRSRISVQFAGFTPRGIADDIQRRINKALNAPMSDPKCSHLLNSILVAQTYQASNDPFADQGGTYAMRTAGSGPPGGNFRPLGTIGNNSFWGLRR